jgi:hypothetical protein
MKLSYIPGQILIKVMYFSHRNKEKSEIMARQQTTTPEDFYNTAYPGFNDEAFTRLLETIKNGEMAPKALLSLIENKQLTEVQARVATDVFPYPWPRRDEAAIAGSLEQTQETLAHMSPADLTEAMQFYSGLIDLMRAELRKRSEPGEMPRNTLDKDEQRQAAALGEPEIGPNPIRQESR